MRQSDALPGRRTSTRATTPVRARVAARRGAAGATSAARRRRPRAPTPASACAPTPSGCAPARARAATTYPYGDTRMPGVCNDARAVHPAVELLRHERPVDLLARSTTPCLEPAADSLDAHRRARRLRHRRGRVRHDGQPPRVDRRSRGHVPRRLLRRHRAQRQRLPLRDDRARRGVLGLLDRLSAAACEKERRRNPSVAAPSDHPTPEHDSARRGGPGVRPKRRSRRA